MADSTSFRENAKKHRQHIVPALGLIDGEANLPLVVDAGGLWYPSSKTCSSCKAVKAKLPLGERTFSCEHCGLEIDRDQNAAANLAALAAKVAASGAETLNGRGGKRSQAGHAGQCFPLKRLAGAGQPDKTGTAVSKGTAALTAADK